MISLAWSLYACASVAGGVYLVVQGHPWFGTACLFLPPAPLLSHRWRNAEGLATTTATTERQSRFPVPEMEPPPVQPLPVLNPVDELLELLFAATLTLGRVYTFIDAVRRKDGFVDADDCSVAGQLNEEIRGLLLGTHEDRVSSTCVPASTPVLV